MQQDINFLPESYRQQVQRRRKTLHRRMALVVALLLIVAGAFEQRRQLAQLRHLRDEIQTRARRVAAQLQDAGVLRTELHRLDARASLVAHLEAQVRTTCVLAAVSEALPEVVTLTHFRMAASAAPTKVSSRSGQGRLSPSRKKDSPPQQTGGPAEWADIRDYRETWRTTRFGVFLEGIAPDDQAISAYLAALEQTGLFDDVTLTFAEGVTIADQPQRRFAVALRLRPIDLQPADDSKPAHGPARPALPAAAIPRQPPGKAPARTHQHRDAARTHAFQTDAATAVKSSAKHPTPTVPIAAEPHLWTTSARNPIKGLSG